MSPIRSLLVVAAAALLVTSVVGLVTDDGGPTAGPAQPGEVEIVEFAYEPDTLSVAAGTTVTWTNGDKADHTVDSTGGGPMDSDSIKQDQTYEVTFDEPGSYAYVCAFHPFMKGTVEVTG